MLVFATLFLINLLLNHLYPSEVGLLASKLYGANATIIILVSVLSFEGNHWGGEERGGEERGGGGGNGVVFACSF